MCNCVIFIFIFIFIYKEEGKLIKSIVLFAPYAKRESSWEREREREGNEKMKRRRNMNESSENSFRTLVSLVIPDPSDIGSCCTFLFFLCLANHKINTHAKTIYKKYCITIHV